MPAAERAARADLLAAVLVGPPADVTGAPPGVPSSEWWRALAEDTADVVAGLASVQAAVAVTSATDAAALRPLLWPGTAVLELPPGGAADLLVATLDALADRGGRLGVVLAGDAPDLPGLLVGKLFSALEDAPVSVSPARAGGLVGLGCRLPAPPWLRACGVTLDTADAVEQLHAAAPERGVVVGPGWHRLRAPGDVAALDPQLEGWDATRALLSGR